MFSSTSFSTRDRLRRSKSARSIRRSRRAPEPGSVQSELAKSQATAAASHAMRWSSERSSTDSRNSYDRVGGPGSVAIPSRRPGSSLLAEGNRSICPASLANFSTPRQSLEMSRVGQSHYLEDSAVLPPITEFNGLDGRNSSLPSSYRRLRKAKSMFSTRTRASKLAGDSWPPHVDPADVDRSPELPMPRTLRHSISFFRSNRETSRAARSATSQDAAVQLARHQFMQETNETETQLRRSSFFSSRHKNEPKQFRKTFRVSSDSGVTVSRLPEQPRSRRVHGKSRSFSVSIKRGIKRVFGLSKADVSSQEITVLPGDLDPHEVVLGVEPDNSEICQSNNLNHCFDPSLLRTMTSSPSGDSLSTSQSRVTSWADSTAANTITTRKPGHRQSLSLIEEYDDFQQHPRVITMKNMEYQPALHKKASPRRLDGAVDSRDLYTALMEQISRSSPRSTDEEVVFGTVKHHLVVPERTSSALSKRSRRTIRHVPSEESFTSPTSFVTARGHASLTPQKNFPRQKRDMLSGKISRHPTGQESSQPINFSKLRLSPRAAYSIGEESDHDNGSVIVARSGGQEIDAVSPSVYSRRSSSHSPAKSEQDDALGANGEPGTATIFASQRTTYSSPRRGTSSASLVPRVQPSADWQQWMSSQIERIEKATPTRTHVREDAQFEDDEDLFASMLRRGPRPSPVSNDLPIEIGGHANGNPPLPEYKVSTQSNFSRPFSRSSSLRTLVSSKKVDTGASDISPQPPHAEIESIAEGKDPSGSSPIPKGRILSPVRSRSRNMPLLLESPTPKRTGPEAQKRRLTQEQYRRYSARRAPIASEGKAAQFRSLRTRREYRGQANENVKQPDEHGDLVDNYHKLQDIHSTISSKHMVDMFLDSRRQQMGTQMADNGAFEEAFL